MSHDDPPRDADPPPADVERPISPAVIATLVQSHRDFLRFLELADGAPPEAETQRAVCQCVVELAGTLRRRRRFAPAGLCSRGLRP